jgi:hypothetical protein
MAGPPGDDRAEDYMTRRHDQSLHEPGASVCSENALDATLGESGAPDVTASPATVRGVLVPYHAFMERRGLIRRVIVALARFDETRTIDLERHGGYVEKDKPRDEPLSPIGSQQVDATAVTVRPSIAQRIGAEE